MAKKRTCDACGKRKKLRSGKTCSTGHFICYSCRRSGGVIFTSWRKKCPVCEKKLR